MMEEICRCCLEPTDRSSSIHILHKSRANKTISQLISELASIQIFEDDLLPKYLCIKCHENILALSDFREQIITSEACLKANFLIEGESFKTTPHPLVTQEIFKSEPDLKLEPYDRSNIVQCEDQFQDARQLTIKAAGRKPSQIAKIRRKIHEFKCDICEKVLFGRSNRLEQHIITAHSDIKNYCCEICHKKFKSKQQLVNHGRVHTGEKPYKCEECEEFFATPQNLFNHKKKHNGTDKTYKCDLCSKRYSTPGELETHRRIVHTGEKPFMCEICSKTYSSTRNLGLHIKSVHEKTEKCTKCGIMLSKKRVKAHLQKHLDKEAGIRRFTCDKCGKGFFTPHALKKHQIVHTEERPHSCKVCSKAFSQKSALDVHMKTHSDVRNFCCELCPKTFKYKQHLQMHVAKKHQNEVV